MTRRLLAAAFAACVLTSGLWAQGPAPEPAAAEPYAEIPGTHISMRIPQGFSLREGFPGFVRTDVGAFVIASELDAPLADVLADMTPEAMEADGIMLLRSEKVSISGQAATIFHTVQQDRGDDIRKWFLLFGSDKLSVLLAASAPAAMEGQLGKVLEQTLLTAQWFPDRVIDPYAGMGFSLRPSETFEIRGRKPGGVLLARKDAPQELSPAEPILVIYSSTSAAVAPLAMLAREELNANPQFTSFTNMAERAVTVNGLNGYEIITDAKETSTQVPVRILLVAVRGNEREMILEAIVARESWEKYLPEFRALADSFQLTSSGHAH